MDIMDDMEEGMFADEAEEIPVDYEIEDGDAFGDEDSIVFTESEDEDEQQKPEAPPTKWSDQVKLIHLRRYIDQMAESVQERTYDVQKSREELNKCREHIEELQNERDEVAEQVHEAEETSNMAALYRLKANYDRLCQELENEIDLEGKIAETLDKAEYDLAKAQVEQGKLLLAEDALKEQEEKVESERADAADIRNKKEQIYADQALRKRRAQERAQTSAMLAEQKRRQHQLEEAVKSHAVADKYLEKTINKMNQRVVEEEARQKDHVEKRMTTMLKLKKDIANNRENMRALQARNRAMEKNKSLVEEQKRLSIESSGGNHAEEMIKQKRLEEFEKEKELHKLRQRQREIEIADKILQEEERMKRRKHQQPYLYTDPQKEKEKTVKPHPRRKIKTLGEGTDQDDQPEYEIDMTKFEGRTGDESDDDEDESISPTVMNRESITLKASSHEESESTLAKPEFEGMWDKHKVYKAPKDMETEIKLPGSSKMQKHNIQSQIEQISDSELRKHLSELDGVFQDEDEAAEFVKYLHGKKMDYKHVMHTKRKEILKKVLDKHREGIVVKQVAAGKEFHGRPFYSKPDVIHFKDFDVGKTYKKKVILTNVSYSVNYCKLVGLTEHLKDFIDLHFDPPGQMSAGLTCELHVTFKPMINEDLGGEVSFLAQTGPFAIPLICTTKKCDLKVDKTTVDFGTSVIGETLKKTYTLSNNGALATKFAFYKLTAMKNRVSTTADSSIGRLTTADTDTHAVSPEANEAAIDSPKKVTKPNNLSLDVKQTEKESEPLGEGDARPSDDDQEKGEEDQEDAEKYKQDTARDTDRLMDQMDDIYCLDGMTVGAVASGEINPFSTVKLEVVWQPTIPGKVDTDFCIDFEDPDSEKIMVNAVANAIDVPVWVERQTVDLKICMLDRLYQDTIVVNNRATTALRLKFEVCKELRNHLELLPKTGYIQAQSQFSAQLKFLPRPSLFNEAGEFFDKETGVLEAPMTIRVADQTRPVPFTVHAVVTNSDLLFDITDIDFGHCTLHEAVTKSVKLTNHSILPQQFGFLGIPDYMDIQPNDGFGTLLPLETVELDIIFKPSKAKVYNFELTCKSLINREFKITCKGVGVLPPMELSKQVIHFAATALDDVCTASIHVINSHTSTNEFTHPVPRIGKGEIAPVGPTSFEFVVPEDAPITISPTVGTVEPGKKCHVHIRFCPKLGDQQIRKEAVRMVSRAMEIRAQEEYKAAIEREKELQEQQNQKGGNKKGGAAAGGKSKAPSPKGKGGKGQDSLASVTAKGPPPIQPPDENKIIKDSDDYVAAHTSLVRQFRGKFQSFVIPCYVASGKCGNPGELPYSVHNTLYLEVHCPAVKPQLVVISDNGRQATDFGDISIGQSVIKSITIQNITDKTVDLRSSCLDPAGPFSMLNALRVLPPDASHTILVCFVPLKGEMFQEELEIFCPLSTLHLTLKGRGVSPMVNLSVKDGVMDIGAVIAGEYREETFKINNTSTLSVQYSIKLDSQSLLRYNKAQGLPHFIKRDKKHKSLVGTQNNNGQQVFDCVPAEDSITAGGSKEVTVTFAPDHSSDHYSDGVRIELFGQEEQHVFQLKGESKPHIMYIDGGDNLLPEVESLAVLPVEEPEEETKPPPIPVLVTLRSVAKETEFVMATRDINIGCVRTMAVSQKKNGEWQFDNLQPITALGFNIDPVKGMIEAGTKRPITITWMPPAGYDTNKAMEATIMCTVKGDATEQYRIMLRGIVTSE